MAGEGTTGTLISWNVTNWFTIVLMGAVGFGIVAAAQSWYAKRAS